MKLIIALIQPNRLEAVKQALNEAEIFRLTVSNVQGYGRQKGHTEYFRGQEYHVNLLPKVQLEIACNDTFVQPCIDAILKGARSNGGQVGDGKIFVTALEECVRISDGAKGSEAI
jgi:nitrogen regulatory protein P-II 1